MLLDQWIDVVTGLLEGADLLIPPNDKFSTNEAGNIQCLIF